MTRISVTVDPLLIEEARRLTQVRTKRAAIERALQEFIRHHGLQVLQIAPHGPLTSEWREEPSSS